MDGRNGEAPRLSVRQMIEALQDGVILTDPRGTIKAVNRAFCAVTGYARREVIGKNPRILHSGRQGRSFYSEIWSSLLRDGTWRGEIWNRRRNGESYPEFLAISAIKSAEGKPLYYLGVFSDISGRKASEERLNRWARYDALTNLPNRRLFNERLKRILADRRSTRRLAVFFLDLDHFKEINDRWGHAAGDLFLRAVGARLAGCVRATDVVARWAGDEFLVLMNPIDGRPDAVRVARKILRVLNRPFMLHGRRVRTAASIGISLLGGKASAAELIRNADKAMYAVKKCGRNGFAFYGDRAGESVRIER